MSAGTHEQGVYPGGYLYFDNGVLTAVGLASPAAIARLSGRGEGVKTYRVVLEGTTLPGFAPDDVCRRLAALTGRSEEVAAKLLGGRPSTVKKGIDQATGLRYVGTLRKIGAACRLEPETLELDLPPTPATAPVAAAPTPVHKSSTALVVTKAVAWVIGLSVATVIGLSVVIGIISVATGPHTPSSGSTNTADDLTIAQKAQQDRQRESDARLAEQMAQFAAERTALIAKAKQLNSAGKYADALQLGSMWLFAGDRELDAQTNLAREKVAAQTERVERTRKRKEGVNIGMTAKEVLESSWGKPQSVNSTHTAAGTREQWVYSGGYLYFDNGVLTAIQN
jgi:hypothetical protein